MTHPTTGRAMNWMFQSIPCLPGKSAVFVSYKLRSPRPSVILREGSQTWVVLGEGSIDVPSLEIIDDRIKEHVPRTIVRCTRRRKALSLPHQYHQSHMQMETHLPVRLSPGMTGIERYSILLLLDDVPRALPFVQLTIEQPQIQ